MALEERISDNKAVAEIRTYKCNNARNNAIECAAMAIVNYTNEINKADIATRQSNNDKCFDYAMEKIIDAIKQIYRKERISWEQDNLENINQRDYWISSTSIWHKKEP